MKNIDTDKLITDEPYWIEAYKRKRIITILGIYKECYNKTFFFCGALSENNEGVIDKKNSFFFTEKEIENLTHLKRGEVIK